MVSSVVEGICHSILSSGISDGTPSNKSLNKSSKYKLSTLLPLTQLIVFRSALFHFQILLASSSLLRFFTTLVFPNACPPSTYRLNAVLKISLSKDLINDTCFAKSGVRIVTTGQTRIRKI